MVQFDGLKAFGSTKCSVLHFYLVTVVAQAFGNCYQSSRRKGMNNVNCVISTGIACYFGECFDLATCIVCSQ